MSTVTSVASGNWSNTNTWTGGVTIVPANAVTINHAITLDVNATVAGIDAASIGSLIIGANNTNGYVQVGNIRPGYVARPIDTSP